MDSLEAWDGIKRILIILAHPDDPEFFLGGTVARWIKAGHIVSYHLLTKGDKGASNLNRSSKALARIRVKEQISAGNLLGVQEISFSKYPDGYLVANEKLRKDVVRIVRSQKPEIVVTCDPTNIFHNSNYINHPDHRAAGKAVIDAVFPAVGNPMYYQDLSRKGLQPHTIEEVWMSLTNDPNMFLDVSEYWEIRAKALKEHKSQIGDPDQFYNRLLSRLDTTEIGTPIYIEKFRRIVFRK